MNKDASSEEVLVEAVRICNEVRKLLRGRGQEIEIEVIAQLTALYLARHIADLREQALIKFIELVRQLIPSHVERIKLAKLPNFKDWK
jgi:hypothetical protein